MGIKLKTDFKGSPPRPFRRKDGTFYIRLRWGGADIWRSCRTKVKKDAEAVAYAIWYKQQSEGAASLLEAPASMLLPALQEYLGSREFAALSPSTQRSRRVSISAFWQWAESRKLFYTDSITRDLAEIFLLSRGSTRKTFRNVQGDLIKALDAVCRKEGRENPFASITPPAAISGEVRKKGAFTHEDLERIFAALSDPATKLPRREEWHRACKIALYTGLRLKDVCLLEYSSITDGKIDLAPAKTAKKTGGKRVLIKYPAALQEVLFPHFRIPEGYVLPALAEFYRKDPTHAPHPFSDFLRDLGVRAEKGESIGFHSFRVTLVTRLREAGYPAEVIRGLVGHTTGSQTEYYNRAALSIDLERVAF